MARNATMLHFDIDLSDVDRNIYQRLCFKAAQHPSENTPYLIARIIAYALEFEEGLSFTRGLSSTDEPALWVKDLTGQLRTWIEVGTPSGERLHKASKAADHVIVYCHKDPNTWLPQLKVKDIYKPETITLIGLPPKDVETLANQVERRNIWQLSRIDDVVYCAIDDATYTLEIDRLAWH